MQLLKDVLDPKNVRYMKYRPLLRHLQGIPQLEFIKREVVKLAKLAESRDLNRSDFKALVDPAAQESFSY